MRRASFVAAVVRILASRRNRPVYAWCVSLPLQRPASTPRASLNCQSAEPSRKLVGDPDVALRLHSLTRCRLSGYRVVVTTSRHVADFCPLVAARQLHESGGWRLRAIRAAHQSPIKNSPLCGISVSAWQASTERRLAVRKHHEKVNSLCDLFPCQWGWLHHAPANLFCNDSVHQNITSCQGGISYRDISETTRAT